MNQILSDYYSLPIELLKEKWVELTLTINHLQDPQARPYLELLREIINERIEQFK